MSLAADEASRAALAAVAAHCDALACEDAQPGAPCDDAATTAAAAWAEAQGVRARLHAASFGSLRGAAAAEEVRAGVTIVALPPAALLTAQCAYDAPGLGDALRAIEGINDDTAALVWTMLERAEGAASPRAAFWAALPAAPLQSGLTLPPAALAALEGTLLHEEARRLQEAAREQYGSLFPALLDAFPAVFAASRALSPDAYSFEAYCLAAELWQAYAVRVAPCGGGAARSALLPQALLLNHGCAPHCVRFSAPDADGVLRLRALRRCPAGAQLRLSYGALPNAHLLLFYGFTLPDNPYDTFPLAFELPEPEEEEGDQSAGEATAAARAALLVRWHLSLEHSLRRGRLPSRLLGALRVLTATPDELAACDADPRCAPLSAANERTVVLTLAATLDALLEGLPPVPQPREGDVHAAALAHCAVYLQAQRDIVDDAQRECAALLAALGEEE